VVRLEEDDWLGIGAVDDFGKGVQCFFVGELELAQVVGFI